MPWPRLLERRFAKQALATPQYTGTITLLCMDVVSQPLWVESLGSCVCIVDAGYMWLQQSPTGTCHTVTTQFDAQGEVVQWYLDICLQHGVDETGMPWWDDLFLDVLVSPNRQCEIVDGDELDEALQAGRIDSDLYRLAWQEARRLVTAIEGDHFPLLALSLSQRVSLLQQIAG